jgi:hypothetical protein
MILGFFRGTGLGIYKFYGEFPRNFLAVWDMRLLYFEVAVNEDPLVEFVLSLHSGLWYAALQVSIRNIFDRKLQYLYQL